MADSKKHRFRAVVPTDAKATVELGEWLEDEKPDIVACAAALANLAADYDDLQAKAEAMADILERILRAHDTGNIGATMGQAILCVAYADLARIAVSEYRESDNG